MCVRLLDGVERDLIVEGGRAVQNVASRGRVVLVVGGEQMMLWLAVSCLWAAGVNEQLNAFERVGGTSVPKRRSALVVADLDISTVLGFKTRH